MMKKIIPLLILCMCVLLCGCGAAVPTEIQPTSTTSGSANRTSESDPISVRYSFYGEGGVSEYFSSDAKQVQELYRAIHAITIKKETQEVANDFDDRFEFTMADGSSESYSFNMHHFEQNGSYYLISDDAPVWTIAHQLEPVERIEP